MRHTYMLMMAVGATLALYAAVSAEAVPAQAPETHVQEAIPEMTDEDKRAWQNLHGEWGKRGWKDMNTAWGKRGWNDMNSAWGKRAWNDMNSAWGKRAWNDMNSAWGKRAWEDMNTAWGKRAWNNLRGNWGKRAWQNFHGAWGKRDPTEVMGYLTEADVPQDADVYELNSLDEYGPVRQMMSNNADRFTDGAGIDTIDNNMAAEKKAWTSLHGPWGKRSAAASAHWYNPKANKNGAWGKREPTWNNLKGLWGKRSSWEGLQGLEHNDNDGEQ